MDIISYYSAGIPNIAPRSAAQSDTALPEVKFAAAGEYRKMFDELGSAKPAGPDTKLYNGSAARAKLSDVEKAELVRQLADRNSDFYTNMRTALKAQVDKNKEDQEQQAIIDAMAAVLDAMSGREPVTGEKQSVNKSATELTKKIGERIGKLDPDDPERIKLENMLKRLQEMGIYVDIGGTDDWWQDEDESFETLTQLLVRRQAEEINAAHPNEKEVNEPA